MATDAAWLKQLYDDYRTALMNRDCYGRRCVSARRWNRAMEIAIAVGTSGAVASWAVWKTDGGESAFAVLVGASTLLAVAKPVLNLGDSIATYGSLFVAHGDVYHDLREIVRKIDATRVIDDESRANYAKVLQRVRELAAKDDLNPNRRLLERCYVAVNEQAPAASLWLPAE